MKIDDPSFDGSKVLHLTATVPQLEVALSVALLVECLVKGGGLICRKLMKSLNTHHVVKTIAVFIFATLYTSATLLVVTP